jgi:hypothetical protein
MSWYNTGGSTTYQVTGVNSAELFAVGYPGYPTQAQAAAHPHNASLAQDAAMAQVKASADIVGGAQNPGGAVSNAANAAAGSVANDALKPLFQAHIWLRVAEVVAGLVLIAIGLNSMLKGKPLSVVSSTAGLASKVVPA